MKIKLAELIVDFSLYPRAEVDARHVYYMCEAFSAGAEFPLIVADRESKRIVDGVHRHRMFTRMLPEDASVDVSLKDYANDAEMFLDAMRRNAGHGRTLTTFDRTHCLLRAEEFKLSLEQVAIALSLTKEAVGHLRKDRVGKLHGPAGTIVPLKRTIRHMAGRNLTKEQSSVNDKLSGMEQLFYVNQLVMLLESNLIDDENEQLLKGLAKLAGLLSKYRKRAAA